MSVCTYWFAFKLAVVVLILDILFIWFAYERGKGMYKRKNDVYDAVINYEQSQANRLANIKDKDCRAYPIESETYTLLNKPAVFTIGEPKKLNWCNEVMDNPST